MALHRYLLGGGDITEELLISVYCEEFHTRPLVAVQDLLGWDQTEEPAGLSLRIIETRNYVRTHEQLERMKDDPDAEIEDSPLVDLVKKIGIETEAEMARAEIDEMRASMQQS